MNIQTFFHTLFITFFWLLAGVLFFGWYNHYIVFSLPHKPISANHIQKKEKRICPFFFLHHDTWIDDTQEIVWSQNSQENCATLIKNWITFCENEHCQTKKITLQTCLISQTGTTVFLSFDRSPFTKHDSIKTKITWCESILKTIKANFPPLENVYFLVHQQPLKDYHLDFTRAWPLTSSPRESNSYKKQIIPGTSSIIMIDPAGNALHTGRIIDDTFERSISLHAAQALQKELERLLPHTRIILTRLPGDTVEPLQNASFANKLMVDLYISLHFFKEHQSDPSLALYYMLIDPDKDRLYTSNKTLNFVAYQAAHKINLPVSQSICHVLYNNFVYSLPHTKIYKPSGIPSKGLFGIVAPALLCELGITHKDGWQDSIPLLAKSIAQLFVQ